ncbi:MAG: hypothetical protein ACYDAY_11570 [Candidatus Dormibacteria bacterium]
MSRIRTHKPEMWSSEDFLSLDAHGRLIFQYLIDNSDDDGRLKASVRHLRMTALNGLDVDEAAVGAQMAEMQRRRMIDCYTVDGATYVALVNWSTHQKVDHKKPSTLPHPNTGEPVFATSREAARERSTASENARESSRGCDPHAGADRPTDRPIYTPDPAAVENPAAPVDEGTDGGPADDAAEPVSESVGPETGVPVDLNCLMPGESVDGYAWRCLSPLRDELELHLDQRTQRAVLVLVSQGYRLRDFHDAWGHPRVQEARSRWRSSAQALAYVTAAGETDTNPLLEQIRMDRCSSESITEAKQHRRDFVRAGEVLGGLGLLPQAKEVAG